MQSCWICNQWKQYMTININQSISLSSTHYLTGSFPNCQAFEAGVEQPPTRTEIMVIVQELVNHFTYTIITWRFGGCLIHIENSTQWICWLSFASSSNSLSYSPVKTAWGTNDHLQTQKQRTCVPELGSLGTYNSGSSSPVQPIDGSKSEVICNSNSSTSGPGKKKWIV